jgi:arylsulfatase A-like enzyme
MYRQNMPLKLEAVRDKENNELMKTRREFMRSIGIGSLAVTLPSAVMEGAQSGKRPNIVFIMSDDHAAHAIGAYGSVINKTPNIDRIAEEGMRFDNCFCTNSLCAPSRAVILTGKYSHVNRLADNRNRVGFDGSQQTLPKLLQQTGYRTAIVGKWHLGSPPTGFHYSNVLPGQGDYHDPVMIENGESRKHTGYVTDIITDEALGWLREQESSTSPFFLMLHHKAPHADWEPDEKHMHMYADADIPLPATFNDDYKTRTAQIKEHRLHVGPKQWALHFRSRLGDIPEGMTEQETREWVYQRYMKDYLRCIASVDDNIGRVLDYLDESGLSKNTIVVYTSDQGFFLGDHGLYDKRFMYEHSLRMPFLMRYPGHIAPHSTADANVLNLDFASTFLDYANVPIPEDIQGESFKRIAGGKTPEDWRTAMYYSFQEEAFGIGPHEGIRTKRHKLIHFLYGDMGWELYDLDVDSNELNNLYESRKNGDLVKQLKSRLKSLKEKYGAT